MAAEPLRLPAPADRINWARRMVCELCGRLIADHPWPGGMHWETVGLATGPMIIRRPKY